MGGGSSESSSTPVDMTPPELAQLRSPFADMVAGLLGYESTSGSNTGTGGTQGPGGDPYKEGVPGYTPTPYTPTGDPNDPLRGIPAYPGTNVAPITQNEQDLLDQLMGMSGQNTDAINSMINGDWNSYNEMAPYDPNLVKADPSIGTHSLSYDTGPYNTSADPFSSMGLGDMSNPYLTDAITSAQQTTMDNMATQLEKSLPGMFTQAGQIIQYDPNSGVGGSAAFNQAASDTAKAAMTTSGQIATDMSYQAWDAERNRQVETINAQQDRILQSISSDRSNEAQFQNSELQRQYEALEAEKQRLLTQSTTERGMEFQGNETQADRQAQGIQLNQQEVTNAITNLQAQALPRMIEDLGIERGMDEFSNRLNSLLILLQTAAGVSTPTVASQSESSSTTKPTAISPIPW